MLDLVYLKNKNSEILVPLVGHDGDPYFIHE